MITLLPYSPLYIAWMVGFVLALARWRRHPRISLLAAWGFALLFLASLAGNYVSVRLPLMLVSKGMPINQLGPWYLGVGVAQSLINAVATGLLIAAVFTGRRSDQ